VPPTATVVEVGGGGAPAVGTARRVATSEVGVGQVMLVKPGEQVPLDGEIVHGRALVSAEHITGEAVPALRRPGDALPAGALCRDGVLAVRATRLAADSTPARIARLARDAQAQRPQLRTWLDAFGEAYSRAVVAATLAALVGMLCAGVPLLGAAAQRGALYRAMTLLTVASPCALAMVPLAYVAAIAAVASRGVLLKGGRVLDALDGCRVVAVDKTGTLTTGRLSLTSFARVGPVQQAGGGGGGGGAAGRDGALAAAAALSLRSSHPVSDAVVMAADREGLGAAEVAVADFRLTPGGGVEGAVELPAGGAGGRFLAAFGSLEFAQQRLNAEEAALVEEAASGQGRSGVVSVLVLEPAAGGGGGGGGGGRSVWAVTFQDSLREQSAEAVRALQEGSWAGRRAGAHACEVVMLTGDNAASAGRVASALGIATALSSLTPEDKLRQVAALQRGDSGGDGSRSGSGSGASRRRRVIMVGDGLNDAAALAAADVGVAIASEASAAASLAADAVVVSAAAGVAAVPLLLRVERATRHVLRQNLALAAGSILVLALPAVLGVIPLWVAVLLHEGSTLLVALNSLRLLRFSAALQRASGGGGRSAGGAGGAAAAAAADGVPAAGAGAAAPSCA
jgi:heavy metal translocating P-type ATPase